MAKNKNLRAGADEAEPASKTIPQSWYQLLQVNWTKNGGAMGDVENAIWSSSDAAIGEIIPVDGNANQVVVHGLGQAGEILVTVTGDTKIGEGENTISATFRIVFDNGEVTSAEIIAKGDPSETLEGALLNGAVA